MNESIDTSGIDREHEIREQAAAILDTFADAKELTLTRDTLDMFRAKWGGGDRYGVDTDLPSLVYYGLQPRGKGTPRVNVSVIDFGDWRAVYVV